jgi:23S rRNA pseudouridine1911/1915/1917 synthase
MDVDSEVVSAEHAGQTLAAWFRSWNPEQSWSQVRRLIHSRQVKIGGELCLDPARRLKEGEIVEILPRPLAKPQTGERIHLRYLDEHIVVVEKPTGINTVRHPSERDWPAKRKALSPALDDLVPKLIAAKEGRLRKGVLPRVRIVQRLDKETSGLVVFARSVAAERGLGKQFHAHTVTRRYLAIVPETIESQRIESTLVRDRGDGRRGSTRFSGQGKQAITHVEVVERLPRYTLVGCRLETGRTHQIRIHLAEAGHPICGEKVYNRDVGEEPQRDKSHAPRLALHAIELGFVHPVHGTAMQWEMPLPTDLAAFLESLRKQSASP